MKNYIIIVLSVFCFTCCKSQEDPNASQSIIKKNPIINKIDTMYYIPIVTSEFEKMDFKKIKEAYLKLEPQQNPEASLYGYTYDETFENKIINHDFYETKKEGIKGGTETTYYSNSPFMIKKQFYPNGNIKEKGLYIVNGDFYKGVWYYYNEKGDLTHSINNDIFFKYTWEDVALFMKENDIQIYLGKPKGDVKWASINSYVTKKFPESSVKSSVQIASEPLWTITWRKIGSSLNDYTEVSLDGTTGKMGYRKKYTIADEPGDEGKEEIEYFNLPKDKK